MAKRSRQAAAAENATDKLSEQALSLGEVAYEAYRASTGGKSLVSGLDIPPFGELPPVIRDAWQAAGDAVAAHVGRADRAQASHGHYETLRRKRQGA